jgi:hypothetical protein
VVATLSVAFAPDAQTLAVGDNDGNVHLFETDTGKYLRLLGSGSKSLKDFTVPSIGDVSFSADGQTLVAAEGFLAGGDQRRVRLWDVETGKELGSVPLPVQAQCKWTWAALSPAGKYLAVAARSGAAPPVAFAEPGPGRVAEQEGALFFSPDPLAQEAFIVAPLFKRVSSDVPHLVHQALRPQEKAPPCRRPGSFPPAPVRFHRERF